ncbi:MAG: hypothetical protein QXF87_01700 [Thermofilaceae archaeon]
MVLTESKTRILAALVEARGDVSEAAKLAGVSKQYVYEVLGKLKRAGVKLRGYPFLSSLGRVFIAFCGYQPPDNGFLVCRLKIYRFSGGILEAGIYLIPRNLSVFLGYMKLRGAVVEELFDIYTTAPWYDIVDLRPNRGTLLPRAPKLEPDYEDWVIMLNLYEDLFAHVTESTPTVSKSRLSYHYRFHVRKILQVLVDFHPEKMHAKPLLFAEVKAPSEEWLSTLLRARHVYILMPRLNCLAGYALLDASDPYDLLKRIAIAREEGRVELEVQMIGYVDLDESFKPRLPLTVAHAGLRTA